MDGVDQVRARLDIVELIGERVELKKAGRTFKALCPFHSERTPSFVVYPDGGHWRCYGACAVGGDAFDFVMRMENLQFREALELLARRTGVDLTPPSAEERSRAERSDVLRSAVDAAADQFQTLLLRTHEAEPARRYLADRGFGIEIAKRFRLGWAPDDYQRTGEALRRLGYTDDVLLEAGLVRERESGGTYDAFRGRVVFPISNVRGQIIGFGARTLDPAGVPKYYNSPQGPLFDKSRVLFGLDKARAAIREAGQAVVVEGYTDVIRAHAAGFENVVASLGTALTEQQVLLLKRFTRRIVLALDADAAGQAATQRGLEVAAEAGAGDLVPVVSGGRRFELVHRAEIDLAVVNLPPGRDPDDVIRDDPNAWLELIGRARPVMEHLFDVLTADLDMADPGGRTTAVDRLLPRIAAIEDPVGRAAWLARLADEVRLDERVLGARLSSLRAEARRRAAIAAAGGGAGGGASEKGHAGADAGRPSMVAGGSVAVGVAESRDRPASGDVEGGAPPDDRPAWLMGRLLVDPGLLGVLDDFLAESGLEPLRPDDLPRRLERDLLVAVSYAARGGPPQDAPAEHRLDGLPDEHARCARLLAQRATADPLLAVDALRAAVCRTALYLRKDALNRELQDLRYSQAEAEPGEGGGPQGDRVREISALRARIDGLLAARLGRRGPGAAQRTLSIEPQTTTS